METTKTKKQERQSLLKGSRVLVVDDDLEVCDVIVEVLQEAGAVVTGVASAEGALEVVEHAEYALMITDVRMPGMDGIELMQHMKGKKPDMQVVVITGHGDIELAVRAMKAGAYDFITKPFSHISEITVAAERALEKTAMEHEIQELRSRVGEVERYESLVGGSPPMQRIYQQIAQVAPTDSIVLVQGETGTGKELVAQAIHKNSKRASGPFIAINCGTLTESLLESELFGHLKGAFTGAHATKIGLFEAASGGTIFLDEIDSTSEHTQLGLLRVLEDKQVRPVGSIASKKVDVRVVASSQKDLFKITEEKKFREDLYYRLSAITISLPPLRERIDDVPLLAEHFLKHHSEKVSKSHRRFSAKAIELLMNYRWPGNVRELENIVEKAVLFSQRPLITQSDLDKFVQNERLSQNKQEIKSLGELECEHIVRVLKFTRQNKAKAANLLGIRRSTLYEKMKRYGISSGEDDKGQENNGEV